MDGTTCTITIPLLNICVTLTQLIIGFVVIGGAFMLLSYINGAATRRQIKKFDQKRDKVAKERKSNS